MTISGNYEMKEQYFIYDGNSLIADIGGYLGLLLGLSIFGIFNSFMEESTRIKNTVQKWFSNGSSRYPRARGSKERAMGWPKEEGNWKSKYTYGQTNIKDHL